VNTISVRKQFCWERWTRAEKNLTSVSGGRQGAEYRRAFERTEFWRKAFTAYERQEERAAHRERLDELALAVQQDPFPVDHREMKYQLPEMFPDLGHLTGFNPRVRKGFR
jgi:hypothetical protein